jgi:GGDEF domain-containing protein
MGLQSIPVLLLFGVSFYAGVFHLSFFINRKDNRDNFYFAVICFSIAFYDAMCIGLYNAKSVRTGIRWQNGQYFAICCLLFAFIYFVLTLTKKRGTWLSRTLAYSMFFMIAAGWIFPTRMWNLQAPRIKSLTVFNRPIIYYEAGSAILTDILFVLTVFAVIYVFAVLLAAYLRQKRKDILPLLIGVVVYFISVILDILIAGNILSFLYTSEYAFIVLIFMMDFTFQKRFVHLFREVETMNVELEDRVKARTREVNQLLQDLSVANGELEKKNAVLLELSERDSLTRLLNHAAFHSRLAEILNAASRHHFSLAVLMLDIDHFKQINDDYGHPVGDRIIKKVAEVLLSTSRNYDIKARFSQESPEAPSSNLRKYDVAGRYGGDEFAVILPYCSGAEAKIVAERIRQRISGIGLPDQPQLSISVSAGGVVLDQKTKCQDEGKLIHHADQALYQAKKSGRNQVVISEFVDPGAE